MPFYLDFRVAAFPSADANRACHLKLIWTPCLIPGARGLTRKATPLGGCVIKPRGQCQKGLTNAAPRPGLTENG